MPYKLLILKYVVKTFKITYKGILTCHHRLRKNVSPNKGFDQLKPLIPASTSGYDKTQDVSKKKNCKLSSEFITGDSYKLE